MVQSVSPSSRSPKTLEVNLLEVAATAVTLYLLDTLEGNVSLAPGPTSLISSPWTELEGEQRFLWVCAHILPLHLFSPFTHPQVGTELCELSPSCSLPENCVSTAWQAGAGACCYGDH